MLTVLLPHSVRESIAEVCRRAGNRETGGMLFGEHVGESVFRVLEATASPPHAVAAFVRWLDEALRRLESFFERTHHEYTRFNYLGEWHSHPSFHLLPSTVDDETMQDMVEDPTVGARFAVLLIVKLEGESPMANGWAYFPHQARERVHVATEPESDVY